MPRPMHNQELAKAKDFKGTILKLFKTLKPFKVLITFALVLAFLGSILSIFAPNQLSKLTDEISKGLVINTKNLEEITNTIMARLPNDNNNNGVNLNDIPLEYAKSIFPEFTIKGNVITSEDQIAFLKIASGINGKMQDTDKLYQEIEKMPASIKNAIKPFMDMDAILAIVLFLVGLYVLSALFTYLESISMTHVANKFAYKLRNDISHKINRLPLKYFDNHKTGDILSRVTNDIDTIAQSMNQSLATLVSSITLFLGTIIMMFITNGVMAITAILASLVGFVLMFVILGKSQKYFVQRQVELGNLNGHIEEIYSGLNVVKTYNGINDANTKFDKYNELVYTANKKSRFL